MTLFFPYICYKSLAQILVGSIIRTVVFSGGWYCSFSLLHYFSYYRYCSKIVDCTVNFYYCTALPIIHTVLKNQACNIYKYWAYNRNLRVFSWKIVNGAKDYFISIFLL